MFWFYLVLLMRPASGRLRLALMVLGFCVAIEYSQLLDIPPLTALRRHFLGRTLVGEGFSIADLFYYAAGVLFSLILDRLLNSSGFPAAAGEPERHQHSLDAGSSGYGPPDAGAAEVKRSRQQQR